MIGIIGKPMNLAVKRLKFIESLVLCLFLSLTFFTNVKGAGNYQEEVTDTPYPSPENPSQVTPTEVITDTATLIPLPSVTILFPSLTPGETNQILIVNTNVSPPSNNKLSDHVNQLWFLIILITVWLLLGIWVIKIFTGHNRTQK